MRVEIKSELLNWACERAGLTISMLTKRFPKIVNWIQGSVHPTLKQIEHFAKVTHTPIGFLFLDKPPVEKIPIPDFRTLRNEYNKPPSPELLDTIYLCQQRQEWYHKYAHSTGEDPIPFIGSVQLNSNIESTAAIIRQTIKFDINERGQIPSWTEALRHFIELTDSLGILVMCNGVVHNNNHRPLDPNEFRGFALVDNLAPLIFVNGKDTKAAQIFTLAHELVHIWLGQSGVSDAQILLIPEQKVEHWCNQVAAEILVPQALLKDEYQKNNEIHKEVNRLARYFKVSTLVILRRIHDIGKLTQKQFWQEYNEELQRLQTFSKSSGGDFYLTQAARASKRFVRALIVSTLEGQTLHRDAFRMLGFSKLETFHNLERSLGMAI